MMWERRIPVSFQLFLGVNSPITGPILEGPRGRFKQRKSRISPTPEFADIGDDADFRSDPTIHARISRMTLVQATPSN